ncbi:MAG: hypothetical protein U0836_15355 [Pirellulales bacterium]
MAGFSLAATPSASLAATIASGSATLTLLEGKANAISVFDAYFNDAATRAQVLADPAPGNSAFSRPSSGVVELVDPVRPGGETPDPYPGTPGSTRTKQITTLDVDPANVLGTWSASNDAFAFVGNTTLGEQIALTSMQRWTGPFSGVLLYGDFALRYVPGRAVGSVSGLVLTSNIDFPSAAFADLANVSITATDSTLSISGDLLISGGIFALDPSATPGTPFGTFAMTTSFVPEPSTAALTLLTLPAMLVIGWRHRNARGQS